MVQLAAMCASITGRVLRFSTDRLRLLCVADKSSLLDAYYHMHQPLL